MALSTVAAALTTATLLAAATGRLPAQQHDPAEAPRSRPHLATAAEQKRGARTAPTHAPQPELPPLVAWLHVKQGNQAAQQAFAKRQPLPLPATRPAGGGRYLCAVLICADADVDIAPLLGLQRRDVLVIAVPGPFTDPLVQTLLERTFAAEGFPLLLMLGHDHCRTLAPRPPTALRDAIDRRIDHAAAEANRRQLSLGKALLLQQREQLLAASDQLRAAVGNNNLRVLPAELNGKTGALVWHHQPLDVLPFAPVK